MKLSTKLVWVVVVLMAIAVAAFPLLAQTEEEVDRDNPAGATTYRQLRLAGAEGISIPDGSIERAIRQTGVLRLRAAARGIRSLGGVPVGPLQKDNEGRVFSGATGDWRPLGPNEIGGRTRAVLIHPANQQIMWMGAVTGGIWKSVDGGKNWAAVADFMANLNVTSLAMSPRSPDLIFAGTGESFAVGREGYIRGAGIFRSLDGGKSWHQLPNTGRFHFVNRLAMTADGAALLAATGEGVLRSLNFASPDEASVTFERMQSGGGNFTTVDCHPSNPDRCLAAGSYAVYWTDAAQAGVVPNAWKESAGLPGGVRVEFAYAAARPDTVYALVDRASGEIYRSVDGGKTFAIRHRGTNFFSHPDGPSQGWYASTVWAGDPTNESLVLIGGIDLWRSTTGGKDPVKISDWRDSQSLHADQHVIVASAKYDGRENRRVFVGNDGGLFQTDDITRSPQVQWTPARSGYAVTQFYGGFVAPGKQADSIRFAGGTQDNGTLIYEGSPSGGGMWRKWLGGDGGFAAIGAAMAKPRYYGSFQYLDLQRSQDGIGHERFGNCTYTPASCIADAGSPKSAPFVAPFALDPSDDRVMFVGASSLWRSPDVTLRAPAWIALMPPRTSFISALAVEPSVAAPRASQVVWIGYAGGEIWRLKRSGENWVATNISGYGLPHRFVTRLRSINGFLFATFAGYEGQRADNCSGGDECWTNDNIWIYSEKDETWRPVKTTLPPMPVYDIAIHPKNPRMILLATEHGVFVASSDGRDWFPVNNGPANVVTHELLWFGTTLVAVTYGRGIFSFDLSRSEE